MAPGLAAVAAPGSMCAMPLPAYRHAPRSGPGAAAAAPPPGKHPHTAIDANAGGDQNTR
jgi:hypothetical protein